MATQIAAHPVSMPGRDRALATAYGEGIRAGLAGAVTIALWFALLDGLHGRWLYTPTVLGTAIFRGGEGLNDPASLTPSLEMVLSFTWIHMLVFLLVGMAAARLLLLAEDDSHMGFGILLLFFVFEFGFVGACMLFAEPVLEALAWPSILAGNLLAAIAMAATFWRGHRSLTIQP
jgi:hypothetical protein